jgi:hypothetical protein
MVAHTGLEPVVSALRVNSAFWTELAQVVRTRQIATTTLFNNLPFCLSVAAFSLTAYSVYPQRRDEKPRLQVDPDR